ncbi:MAG TPA: hypothetical protein VND87_02585 [Stellaceae bacterium]|nr:hypothetical protein [Stellaceae bacterium]
MPEDGLPDDAQIIAAAFEDRVRELFKTFAEVVYTGEPEREAVARFRRGLVSAKRVRDLALEVAKDL